MNASPLPASVPALHRSSLRSRLKRETHDLHRQSERSGIMRMLLLGHAERGAYCALLRNLYEIYTPLEDGLRQYHDHPFLQPVFSSALHRVAPLASDLRVLWGEAWSTEIPVQPAALAYRDRLNALAATDPGLLVAHAYVRYLGDLSDGQILYQLVTETLRLGEEATRFYQFGAPTDVDRLLAEFSMGLDAIPASAGEEDAIVAEAQEAFRRHVGLYEELAGGPAAVATG